MASVCRLAILCALLMFGPLVFFAPGARGESRLEPILQPSFKLTGALASEAGFGSAVAISSDGDTALVGQSGGPVWVFVRSSSGWSEQAQLTPPAVEKADGFGCSVALSANGSTALVGAPGRSASIEGPAIPGAVWVYAREGQTWSEQTKLTPNDGINPSNESCSDFPSANGFYGNGFGFSVSLSGDGNTALVGDGADNHNRGAAWVFTRSRGNWIQQGPKLIPNDEDPIRRFAASGPAFGTNVALSAGGSTALVSAPWSSRGPTYAGQVWVFTRKGDRWVQQGGGLVPRGHVGSEKLGSSVALSGDGNTALVGAEGANRAWVFKRSGSTWSQRGSRLALEPGVKSKLGFHEGRFGARVAMAADGNTALISGLPQNDCGKYMYESCGFLGTVWAFARIGTTRVRRGAGLPGAGAFGDALALSGNGSTALIGAPSQESAYGFAFVSTVSPPTPHTRPSPR
jgi:hypothetical protein